MPAGIEVFSDNGILTVSHTDMGFNLIEIIETTLGINGSKVFKGVDFQVIPLVWSSTGYNVPANVSKSGEVVSWVWPPLVHHYHTYINTQILIYG